MDHEQEKYNQLAYYTLALAEKDPYFIHQHIVDAFGAQNAKVDSKPIGVYFGLMGLYLYIEKNYTGRQVQLAHIKAAQKKEGMAEKNWPTFVLPKERGDITVSNVLAVPAGPERDQMIKNWCLSVWDAYKESQDEVRRHADRDLGLE
jgi:hypothetical protein